MRPSSDYLWGQILRHAHVFFAPQAFEALRRLDVVFAPAADAYTLDRPGVVIPTDIETEIGPRNSFSAPFNGTSVCLWPRLPIPDSTGWKPVASESIPLWFQHRSGTLVPAWNLFGTLCDLLTFREEREIADRDQHGRFVGRFSPRDASALLEVPVFNNAVAVLVGAALGLSQGGIPKLDLSGQVLPPRIILSHDCDILRGNDRWTQAVRLFRVWAPLRRARPPRLQNLWWAVRNAARPHDFYLDNVAGLVTLERMFGYRSTFYVLNGSGGRFGARSGSHLIPGLLALIPEEWQTGIHYNYDTFLDSSRFCEQQNELERISDRPMVAGRAHYLRFDAARSPAFFDRHGIRVDESAGYPDRIGYRCGIGGCFQPHNPASRAALDIVEVPMNVMDGALVAQYGTESVAAFERMLTHLSRVGGALSLVFHPGLFFNPEMSEYRHLYHQLLQSCRALGAVSETGVDLARSFRQAQV